MKIYRCTVCGYKTEKEKLPERCNYCSGIDCMREVEDAKKIVEMI